MKSLAREVGRAGLKWAALKPHLPDWWEDAVRERSGVVELRAFLMKHLGLEVAGAGGLRTRSLPAAKFKTRAGTDASEVASARAMASAIAQLVSRAAVSEWRGIPEDPTTLRAEILGRTGADWVDFEALLEVAWSMGVPVVYLPHLPVTGKKMDGMVTRAAGRPVILLTRKHEQPDWMLFVLAHEVGHLARGHLPEAEGEAIIDEELDADGGALDAQETEANWYASALLAPGVEKLTIGGPLPKADRLADVAIAFAKKYRVSPGHVILNAVRHTLVKGKPPFALANASLKALAGKMGERPTSQIARAAAARHLDLDRLRPDSAEFLESIGIG